MCFRNKLALIPLYDIGNQLGSRYFIITRSSYTVNYASKKLRGGLLSLNLKSEKSFLKRGGVIKQGVFIKQYKGREKIKFT